MALALNSLMEDLVVTPPTVYLEMQRAVEDPDTSFQEFARIIGADPGLSIRLLKIVNSPLYGFESKVESINHALNIVGIDQITDLAFATGVMNSFQGIPKDLIDMESFWRHSIACGLTARHIARLKEVGNPDQYYLAGMLHDIGSLVLYKEAAEASVKLLKKSRETGVNLFKVETQGIQFNHADVGKMLMKKWKIPPLIVNAIGFHHAPEEAGEHRDIVETIHVADILSYDLKLGTGGELGVPKPMPGVLVNLGLSKKELADLKTKILEDFEETCKMFF